MCKVSKCFKEERNGREERETNNGLRMWEENLSDEVGKLF